MRSSAMLVLGCLALCLLLGACSSGGGTSSDGRSSAPAEDTLILPLIGEAPAGMTVGMLATALEAAGQGLGYDFANDHLVPVPVAPSQVLIRPGAQIFPESIFPGWCTAAFVFDDHTRIATAGHCTKNGDAVLALAAPSTIFVMGFTSQTTGPDADPGNDWALIDILPLWQLFTDPAAALVGGPCGQTDAPAVPVIKFVGHGEALGTGGIPRAGLLLGKEGDAFLAFGPANLGDSGAPVLETTQVDATSLCVGGAALGIITAGEVLTVDGIPIAPTGFFVGTPIGRIGHSLDSAGALR